MTNERRGICLLISRADIIFHAVGFVYNEIKIIKICSCFNFLFPPRPELFPVRNLWRVMAQLVVRTLHECSRLIEYIFETWGVEFLLDQWLCESTSRFNLEMANLRNHIGHFMLGRSPTEKYLHESEHESWNNLSHEHSHAVKQFSSLYFANNLKYYDNMFLILNWHELIYCAAGSTTAQYKICWSWFFTLFFVVRLCVDFSKGSVIDDR